VSKHVPCLAASAIAYGIAMGAQAQSFTTNSATRYIFLSTHGQPSEQYTAVGQNDFTESRALSGGDGSASAAQTSQIRSNSLYDSFSGSSFASGGAGTYTSGADSAFDCSFTVTQPTNYFMITSLSFGTFKPSMTVQLTGPSSTVLVDHSTGVSGNWSDSGILTPGTYRLQASFSAFSSNGFTRTFSGFVSFAAVPAPGTCLLPALAGAAALRRRRRA